ncbi:hypothetical protein 1 [Beihai picorna-like virus 90]|uniref:hypothetical protein 1 n=1 Tax=Beihai picorna-like virus 90 TaxID=1922637 RepID=UPI00090BF13D|nr:hypothetical protein 1 [Beihai picorna-like virus 90]APG76897.1 hypothetical protein 1 [Beihai picorna-like virus 90]
MNMYTSYLLPRYKREVTPTVKALALSRGLLRQLKKFDFEQMVQIKIYRQILHEEITSLLDNAAFTWTTSVVVNIEGKTQVHNVECPAFVYMLAKINGLRVEVNHSLTLITFPTTRKLCFELRRRGMVPDVLERFITPAQRDYKVEGLGEWLFPSTTSSVVRDINSATGNIDHFTTSATQTLGKFDILSGEITKVFANINDLLSSVAKAVPNHTSLSKLVKKLFAAVGLSIAQKSYIPLITGLLLEFIEMELDSKVWNFLRGTEEDHFDMAGFRVEGEDFNILGHLLPSWITGVNMEKMLSRFIYFIPTLIIGLFATVVTAMYGKMPDFRKILDNIKGVGMSLKAMREGRRTIDEMKDEAEEAMCVALTGKSRKELSESQTMPALPAIKDILTQMSDPAKQTALSQDVRACQQVLTIEMLLQQYLMQAQTKNDRQMVSILQSLIESNKKLMRIAHGTLAHNKSTRARPATLYLHGKAGVGKSNLCEKIISHLLKEEYDNKTPLEIVHNRTEGSEYWDGFHPDNKIIFYDDFGQQKELASAGNIGVAATEIIKLVNTAPYLLNMSGTTASSVKGGTYCNADYVLFSSNSPNVSSEGITSNDAYRRRIDFRVEVTIKKEYAFKRNNTNTYTLDIPKLLYTQNKERYADMSLPLNHYDRALIEFDLEEGNIQLEFDTSVYDFIVEVTDTTYCTTTKTVDYEGLLNMLRLRKKRYQDEFLISTKDKNVHVPSSPMLQHVFQKWASTLKYTPEGEGIKAVPELMPLMWNDAFYATSNTVCIDCEPRSYIKCKHGDSIFIVPLAHPIKENKKADYKVFIDGTLRNIAVTSTKHEKKNALQLTFDTLHLPMSVYILDDAVVASFGLMDTEYDIGSVIPYAEHLQACTNTEPTVETGEIDINQTHILHIEDLPNIDVDTVSTTTIKNLYQTFKHKPSAVGVMAAFRGYEFTPIKSLFTSFGSILGTIKQSCINFWHSLTAVPGWVWGLTASIIGAVIAGGVSYWAYKTTPCKMTATLSASPNFMDLFTTRTCFTGCQLCKEIKAAPWSKIMLKFSEERNQYYFASNDKNNFLKNMAVLARKYNIPMSVELAISQTDRFNYDTDKLVVGKVECKNGIYVEATNNVPSKDMRVAPDVESQQNRRTINRSVRVETRPESQQNRMTRLRNVIVEDVKLQPSWRNVEGEEISVGRVKHHVLEASDGWMKTQPVTKLPNAPLSTCEVLSGKLKASRENKDVVEFLVEASYDPNATELINKTTTKFNLVRASVIKKDGLAFSTNGLFLQGRLLLVPRHLVDRASTDDISFQSFDGSVTKTRMVSKVDVTSAEGEVLDLVIVECTKNVTARPNIVKNFIKSSEVCYLEKSISPYSKIVALRRMFEDKVSLCLESIFDAKLNYSTNIAKYVDANKVDTYQTVNYIEYSANTQPGDCGGPLIIYDPEMAHKFTGVHLAGDTGFGYSQLITQEMLDRNIKKHAFQVQMDAPMLDMNEDSPLSNCMYMGEVKNGVHVPKDTAIRKTELNGIFEVKTAPAILYDKNVDILLKNAAKMTQDTVLLNERDLSKCASNILDIVSVGRENPKIYSLADVITGTEENFVEPLNRRTSPGYPYVLETKGQPGKSKWLGSGEEYIVDHPEIVARVGNMIEQAKKGIYQPLEGAFIASLKDERRNLNKIAEKKTRVFTACNITLALAIRMYFLDFLRHCMVYRIDNEIALGTNVYSLDWTRIARQITDKGGPVIAGDFSNFDGSLNAQILFKICDVINEWYNDGEENANIRVTLFHYLVNACVLFRNQIVVLNHSQPSGNPLTTLINCMYNMFIFRYVYLQLKKEKVGVSSLIDYVHNVKGIYYGDDSLIGISPKIVSWFNQISITRVMAETGHTYTDETKTESLRTYKNLSEITFLKRTFVPSPYAKQEYLAPISRDTIEDMVMWRTKKITNDAALAQVVPMAVVEASLHGKEYYSSFVKRIRDNLSNSRLVSIPSYEECEDILEYQRTGFQTDQALISQFFG